MEASSQQNIDSVIRRIELLIQKFDNAIGRFSQRDKALFARVVDAVGKHDTARAKILANEVSEIRKMGRTILRSKMAMELILLRVRSLKLHEDVVTILIPVARIMQTIALEINSIFPESGMEIRETRKTICVLIVNGGEAIGSINFESAEKEALLIMAEVDKREEEMKNKPPDLPAIKEIAPSDESD